MSKDRVRSWYTKVHEDVCCPDCGKQNVIPSIEFGKLVCKGCNHVWLKDSEVLLTS